MAVTPLFCACTPAGTSPRALRCFDAVTVLALSRFACLTGNDTDMYWRCVQDRDHTATPGTGTGVPGGQLLLNHIKQPYISQQTPKDLLPHARPFNDRVG